MRVIDIDTGKEFSLYESEDFKSETSAYWAEKCSHGNKMIGKVSYKNGGIHIREVCLTCGAFTGSTFPKGHDGKELPPIDYIKLRTEYDKSRTDKYSAIKQRHVHLQKKRHVGYQKEYLKYLSSDQWKQRRILVLKRANFLCEGCLHHKATIVHHLNYNSIYREMLFDLVALCDDCHKRCHPDKHEMTDEEFFADDLPCYGCRLHRETAEWSWCDKFDVHTVVALADSDLCGPRALALEPLK
jgi:hypothetical protein